MSAKDFRGRLLEPVIADRDDRYPAGRLPLPAAYVFRTYDDVRRSQIQQTFQTVVTVMTRRYRSFRSEVAKRPPSSEPADADLAAVPAERSGSSTLFVTRLNERFQQFDTLGQLFSLVSELVSFSSSRSCSHSCSDPCSSAGPGLLPHPFSRRIRTELFQRVQILLFSQDLLAFRLVIPPSITT